MALMGSFKLSLQSHAMLRVIDDTGMIQHVY